MAILVSTLSIFLIGFCHSQPLLCLGAWELDGGATKPKSMRAEVMLGAQNEDASIATPLGLALSDGTSLSPFSPATIAQMMTLQMAIYFTTTPKVTLPSKNSQQSLKMILAKVSNSQLTTIPINLPSLKASTKKWTAQFLETPRVLRQL